MQEICHFLGGINRGFYPRMWINVWNIGENVGKINDSTKAEDKK